jgi:predicted transposase YbfD/YdcC
LVRVRKTRGTSARLLLAAFDHATGVVLGQVGVAADTNEIGLFTALVDRLDVSGAVVTADALHAQRGTSSTGRPWRALRGHGQGQPARAARPTAVAALAGRPRREQDHRPHPRPGRTPCRQGRHRRRRTGVPPRRPGHPDHPPPPVGKRWSTQTVYAVTSLTAAQATPAQLAELIRGHWSIEDRLHWVRDVVYDDSQIRTGNGPRIMACLRNLAITILRLTGTTNIAAALRHHARQPHRPLQAIKTC